MFQFPFYASDTENEEESKREKENMYRQLNRWRAWNKKNGAQLCASGVPANASVYCESWALRRDHGQSPVSVVRPSHKEHRPYVVKLYDFTQINDK